MNCCLAPEPDVRDDLLTGVDWCGARPIRRREQSRRCEDSHQWRGGGNSSQHLNIPALSLILAMPWPLSWLVLWPCSGPCLSLFSSFALALVLACFLALLWPLSRHVPWPCPCLALSVQMVRILALALSGPVSSSDWRPAAVPRARPATKN